MIFTIREVDIIHKAYITQKFLEEPSDEDVQVAMLERVQLLIDNLVKQTGLSREAFEAINQTKFMRMKVEQNPTTGDWVVYMGFWFRSDKAELRDAQGTIRIYPAKKGRYSVIHIVNSAKLLDGMGPQSTIEKIELKALHFDTEKGTWGFGIPCQKTSK